MLGKSILLLPMILLRIVNFERIYVKPLVFWVALLKKNGIFFLSDPIPNEDDTEHFVDEYMQMKKDGHIKFYTKDEWKEMGNSVGLMYVDDFETKICFPRKKIQR